LAPIIKHRTMINEYEAPLFIAGCLPQLKIQTKDIYKSMQTLTDYTKRMALEHNFNEVKKCMSLVERIYNKGNTLVKNAVENIFIFAFSSMRMLCNIVEWRMVQSFMPSELYVLYIQQVIRSKD